MAAELTRLTHKIAIQLHLVQAASPETFEYTVVRDRHSAQQITNTF